MRIYFFTLSLLISSTLMGAPCDGAPGFYRMNPDGSQGGFVAYTVRIDSTVIIDATSSVCDKANLKGRTHISDGTVVKESAIVEGNVGISNSLIYGGARIFGKLVVQDSTICQYSLISGFNVIKSDYYCQTEDPAPKDPGEEGRKTLLGVDTDGDGVRDDVEVFINSNLPNTPSKNRAEERTATKLLAQLVNKQIVHRKTEQLIKSLDQMKLDLVDCFNISLADETLIKMFNSVDRIDTLFTIAGYFHGERVMVPQKKCKSINEYKRMLNKY